MNRTDQYADIRAIADAVCSDTATEQQLIELEQLLSGNFDAQQFYYDYLNFNMQLQSPADSNTEVVYRRMTEEVVVRSKERTSTSESGATINQPPNSKNYHIKLIAIFGLLSLLLAGLLWLFMQRSAPSSIAQLVKGNLVIIGYQGKIVDNNLSDGVYQSVDEVELQLVDGDTLHLAPNTLIKLFNNKELRLRGGKVRLESVAAHDTIIHGNKFVLSSNGSGLTFDLTDSAPVLTSGEKTMFAPHRWRPKHYWSFDGGSDRIADSAGSAFGVAGSVTTKVKGHVGQAVAFNNSAEAYIDLGSGGGTVPGTGSFAVTDGVTIEALIRPEYSGKVNEVDEIFHKDHGDQELRMVLRFQHDSSKDKLRPEGVEGPSLSFGLFIFGQGYQELKLPLDGKQGRPTLANLKDGNFHHLVASYDVRTGVKAIYLNGKRLAYYQYPPGSNVISGGAGSASVGNNPSKDGRYQEAFAGAIDEVAFYDFALPEYMLQLHLKHIGQGKNYYGLPASATALPRMVKLTMPPYTVTEHDVVTGLPSKIIAKQNSN